MVRPVLNRNIALKVVKALVEAGGDPLLIVMDTCTVLHAISQSKGSSGDEEGLFKTIAERGIPLDIQDQGSGRTPLHLAVQSSEQQRVQTLLNLGASVDIVDLQFQTPLHLACQAKRRKWTRDSPSDLGEDELSAHSQFQGRRGEAAKYHTLATRYRYLDRSMAEEDMVEYLLGYGANPLATDEFGLTPLHYACKAGNPITAGRILRGKSPLRKLSGRPAKSDYRFFPILSAKDVNGQLPLHWAARSGNVEVVRLLLSTDLNRSTSPAEHEKENATPRLSVSSSSIIVNAVDNRGYTALHWAAKGGHEDVVRVLLQETSIAEINLVSTSGHTALDIAVACGHTAIVWELEFWTKVVSTNTRVEVTSEITGLRQRRETRSVYTSP